MTPIKKNKYTVKCKKNIGNILICTSIALTIVSVLFRLPHIALAAALILFVNNLLFSISDMQKNIIFFIFNCTFGVFLLGRFIVTSLFSYDGYWYDGLFELSFSKETTLFILHALILSLLFIFIGYYRSKLNDNSIKSSIEISYSLLNANIPITYAINKLKSITLTFFVNMKNKLISFGSRIFIRILNPRIKNKDIYTLTLNSKQNWRTSLQQTTMIMYFVTLVFHWVYIIDAIIYTSQVGYHGSYLNPSSQINSLVYVVGEMYDMAFFLFLATMPRRRKALIPIMLYIIDGLLFIISGRRMDFMLNLLMIITYLVLRQSQNEEKWYSKKLIISAAIASPLLIIFLYIIGEVRVGKTPNLNNLFNPILAFFYDQGVSARVIGHMYDHLDAIPTNKFYSLGTVIEFVKYRIIGAYILGNPIPVGQSVERAMDGHLFSQTIAYLSNPTEYLKGVGTGSSYIAELYVDFRYIGIILGSTIYGFLANNFLKLYKHVSFVLSAFALLMIRGFYLTPRSGYSSFLTTTFSLRQLLGLLLILFISSILFIIKSRQKEGNAYD